MLFSLFEFRFQFCLLTCILLNVFLLDFDTLLLLLWIIYQIFTSVAFSLFARESIDIAVIEVDYLLITL